MSSNNTISYSTTTLTTPTSAQLELDLVAWFGQNTIRRVALKEVNAYLGGSTNSRYVTLAPSATDTTNYATPTVVTLIFTNQPITARVTINSQTVNITVNNVLVLDGGVTALVLINPSTTVSANVQVLSLN